MNRRVLLLLGAVFVVLLIATLLQGRQLNEQFEQAFNTDFESVRLFPGVAPESVVTLRLIDTAGNMLTLQRNADGTWNSPNLDAVAATVAATPGATASVNTEMVDRLVFETTLLTYSRELSATTEAEYSSYGFSPQLPNGYFTLELVLRDNSTRRLFIGSLTPSREQYYVRVKNVPGVYVVERDPALGGGQIDVLVGNLFEMREVGGQ